MNALKKQYTIMLIAARIGLFFLSSPSYAQCSAENKMCLMNEILATSETIENEAWRDKVLRELAKSYTYEGQEKKAIALIEKIQKPDTKAMTIRGIGMAAADSEWADKKRYQNLFKMLDVEAAKITHPPSNAIAYTYIAMSQAFAKDDEGAMATAKSMQNEALRNKAYGESAEIQAERGDLNAAMMSISKINSVSFKNKAYSHVAAIFTKQGNVDDAYAAARRINNAYAKAQAMQKIVNFGNDEETLSK